MLPRTNFSPMGLYPDNLRALLEAREQVARRANVASRETPTAADVRDQRAAEQTPEPPPRIA